MKIVQLNKVWTQFPHETWIKFPVDERLKWIKFEKGRANSLVIWDGNVLFPVSETVDQIVKKIELASKDEK